jgi:hypothetical protein
MRKMKVAKLGIKDQTYCPVIVLKDPDGNSSLHWFDGSNLYCQWG